MPVLRMPKTIWSNPPARTVKRKRSETNFNIAIDTDISQSGRFKRQNNNHDHDAISSKQSHGIIDVLGSNATDPGLDTLTTKPQPSLLPAPLPSSQSSERVPTPPETKPEKSNNDQAKAPQKWGPHDWDSDAFDSDEENMSLAVYMKLANELSLLKSFLEIYRKFNIHLGDIASGPRHHGFLTLISSTITRLSAHQTRLRFLRDNKQRGSAVPSATEAIALRIAALFQKHKGLLWGVMEEKVDMGDEGARAAWVRKKKEVLGEVMGGMVLMLEELGPEEGWKEREVRVLGERWERRWKVYAAMEKGDLKRAGWILEVGKGGG